MASRNATTAASSVFAVSREKDINRLVFLFFHYFVHSHYHLQFLCYYDLPITIQTGGKFKVISEFSNRSVRGHKSNVTGPVQALSAQSPGP